MQVRTKIWVVIGAALLGVFVSGTLRGPLPADPPMSPARAAHEPVRHPLTLRAVVEGRVSPGATVDVRLDVSPWRRAEDVTLEIVPGTVRVQGSRVRRLGRIAAGESRSEPLRVVLPAEGTSHRVEVRARARIDDAIVERAVHLNFVLRPEPRRETVDRHGRRVIGTPAEPLR